MNTVLENGKLTTRRSQAHYRACPDAPLYDQKLQSHHKEKGTMSHTVYRYISLHPQRLPVAPFLHTLGHARVNLEVEYLA